MICDRQSLILRDKRKFFWNQHHDWFNNSIPLIASENVSSPAVREAVASDFGHRYAEGWPGERVYAGCKFIDKLELECIELAKQFFNA